MKINVLDSSIYNRISAGEVVENPSSVVKELMENAVDAGANNITVSILDGGIKSIEVSDDGLGISKEELPKTILPHATSKITTADDLYTISTLGFRGEALASISAVSDFEIRSRYIESDCGAFLKFKNGEISTGDIAIERGTTILVRNLFYNTPARYKFLGSKSAEENTVSKLVFKFILANPYVAVRYYADGTLIYSSSGSGLKDAIDSVFPSNISDSLIELTPEENDSVRISGYITPPEVFKNNKIMQTVVLNGRIVVDQTITATIQNAYGSRLMARCFPVYIINIVMPFDDVDVNVHPSKKEVRFASPRAVYGKIYNTVAKALDSYEFAKRENLMADFGGNLEENPQKPSIFTPIGESDIYVETQSPNVDKPSMDYREALSIVRGKTVATRVAENTNIFNAPVRNAGVPTVSTSTEIPELSQIKNESVCHADDLTTTREPDLIDTLSVSNEPSIQENRVKPIYKVVGQVFGTYLLIESGDKLLFIDQHAMHERILFDKLIAEIESGDVPIQPLMIPYIYETSKERIALLLNSKNDLYSCGFDISAFGVDAIKIDGIPAILAGKLDVNDCFNSVADELSSGKQKLTIGDIGKDRFATVACKSAIKGSTVLDNEGVALVMDFFAKGNLPLQCPHGRPTAIIYTKSEFEKLFRRKV